MVQVSWMQSVSIYDLPYFWIIDLVFVEEGVRWNELMTLLDRNYLFSIHLWIDAYTQYLSYNSYVFNP